MFIPELKVSENVIFFPFPRKKFSKCYSLCTRTDYVSLAADVDECTDTSHNCHAKADCSNTYGRFNCTCFEGYSGDGVTCIGMIVIINT